ncbi:MAG: hypothetical protein FJ242_00015 [Nitrospira sp.]|nr:hypothetical protein [Nitrospira sp.]
MKSNEEACLNNEIIAAYLDNTLSPKDMTVVEEHLMSCDKCLREAISLNEILLRMSEGEAIPLPEKLREKVISTNRTSKKVKYLSEFVISLSEKAISLIKTAFLPEGTELKVFGSQSPALIYRGKELSGDVLNINQKINDIDIRIQFYNTEGPAASLRVLFLKENLPLSKERITLYKKDRLLSSKVTSKEGNVIFPDINYGYYRISIPGEDIEMSFKILPEENNKRKNNE